MQIAAMLFLVLGAGTVSALSKDSPDRKTTTERFKVWTVSCVEAATRTCRMHQELVQQKSGQRLAALVVETAKDGAASLTVMTPFGLLFAEGLGIGIDDVELARANFLTCLPTGCLVPLALDDTALEKIRAGNTFSATGVNTANGKTVRIEFSLKGSAAALARLQALSVDEPAE
ncbi:invasion associated locus B family protein [Labrenzia sp. VG12]|uniref:invasion associated locus B family protein n=1 Tax=Labrenzia sp. VG12 TaxID=2021862 RepID=UPI0012FD3D23|nr:invasion associated locus B family protein [Labrenzia sp. VG12]